MEFITSTFATEKQRLAARGVFAALLMGDVGAANSILDQSAGGLDDASARGFVRAIRSHVRQIARVVDANAHLLAEVEAMTDLLPGAPVGELPEPEPAV